MLLLSLSLETDQYTVMNSLNAEGRKAAMPEGEIAVRSWGDMLWGSYLHGAESHTMAKA